MSETSIRPAVRDDSPAIARLFLIASDGLADYLWGRMMEPGETIADAGARRCARQGVPFSYENCVIAEEAGRVVGMAHSYPMDPSPGQASAGDSNESDIVLRPFTELADPGSHYIAGLAVIEAARGRGLGRRLMDAVNSHAKSLARPRLSLICFERNEPAMRFFTRLGFTEHDRRDLVPHPTLKYNDGHALLLTRDVW